MGHRLCLFLCLFFVMPARAETLERVEAVARRAGSFEALTHDSTLVDEYYRELAAYYGGEEKFPRASFDAVLKQLVNVAQSVPELKERLWNPAPAESSFTIANETVSYGRQLAPKAWAPYWRGVVDAWKKESAGVDEKAARARLQRFAAETARFETGLVGKKRADAEAARREYFIAKRADTALAAAASRLLVGHFESEKMRDKLGSGDADLILDTMNDTRTRVREIWGEAGMPTGPLTSLMQERIPTVAQLLERADVFPPELRRTHGGQLVPVGTAGRRQYTFRTLPRALHGIWKGIPLGECVGGGIPNGETARRWATVALTGTQFYHVERDGNYQGFVQMVPMKHQGSSETVGSLDIGAPVLRQKAIVADPLTGEKGPASLYELWLSEMRKRLPEGWKGLAIGDTHAIDNAGVLPTARDDFSYRTGAAEPVQGWSYVDAFARQLIAGSDRSARFNYGDGMIFDGAVSREMRLLGPTWREAHPDGSAVVQSLGRGVEYARATARELAKRPRLLPAVSTALEAVPNYPHLIDWARHDNAMYKMQVEGRLGNHTGIWFGAGALTAIFGALNFAKPDFAYQIAMPLSWLLPIAFTGRHYVTNAPAIFRATHGALLAERSEQDVRTGGDGRLPWRERARLACRALYRTIVPAPVVN